MQFASILSAFQKFGVTIEGDPHNQKRFYAKRGNETLMFYVSDGNFVDHFTYESPDTDVMRDCHCDSYFYTIKSALHFLNPQGVRVQSTNTTMTTTDHPVEDVQIMHNTVKGGIEIKFADKPSADIIATLKAKEFRWSGFHGVWWKKFSDEDMKWAKETFIYLDEFHWNDDSENAFHI